MLTHLHSRLTLAAEHTASVIASSSTPTGKPCWLVIRPDGHCMAITVTISDDGGPGLQASCTALGTRQAYALASCADADQIASRLAEWAARSGQGALSASGRHRLTDLPAD